MKNIDKIPFKDLMDEFNKEIEPDSAIAASLMSLSALIEENKKLKAEAEKLLETCVMLKLENARLRVKETTKNTQQ